MSVSRRNFLQRGALAAAGASLLPLAIQPASAQATTTFAIIGDYGSGLPAQQSVANLVASWNPSFVATLGDNVYSGDNADPARLLEERVGRYYGNFVNSGNFFPALGNHDWGDPGTPLLSCSGNSCSGAWLDYFSLPGNGRYYSVRRGPVQVFVLDDYYLDPDGNSATSVQAQWLRAAAAASTATWKIVVHHFPAYSSRGGGLATLRWPFAQWGIDAVFAGHHHMYERLAQDGIPYFVNGLGGAALGGTPTPIAQSRSQYAASHGAMRLRATTSTLGIQFINISGAVIDSVTLRSSATATQPSPIAAVPTTTAPTPSSQVGGLETSINWPPMGGNFRNNRIKLAGWSNANANVAYLSVLIKDLDRNLYWNGTAFASKARLFRVYPEQAGTGSDWSTIISSPPTGRYQARAWTKSASGEIDPSGSKMVYFRVS